MSMRPRCWRGRDERGGSAVTASIQETAVTPVDGGDAPDEPPPVPARRRGARLARRLVPTVIPILVLVGWEVIARSGVTEQSLLPPPTTVLQTLWEDALDGELWDNTRASMYRWVIGFTLGASSGVILGALVGLYKLAETVLDTSVQMFRTVPNLGLIPLLILWLGLGESPKIVMIALACFFPLYLNTFAGIRNVDRRLIEVGNVYNFSGRKMLFKVVLPAALPQIFTGVRYGLGVAWLALVGSELVGASTGLGYMIQMGQALSRVDIVMAGLVVFAVAGKLVDVIVKLAEKRLLRWRDAYVGV